VNGQNVFERRKNNGISYVLEGNCRECKKAYKMAFEDGDTVGERHIFEFGKIAPPFAVLKCEGFEDHTYQDYTRPVQKCIGTQFIAAFDPGKEKEKRHKVTIGRNVRADLQLVHNPQASRIHSQISFDKDCEEGTFHIEDMGSKWGTFLENGPDGIELDDAEPLELRFGCMALKIEYVGASAPSQSEALSTWPHPQRRQQDDGCCAPLGHMCVMM